MYRAKLLKLMQSQCKRCAIRALVVTAAMVGPAVVPVNSQGAMQRTDAAIEVLPASRVPASPMLASRASSSPELLAESTAQPVDRILRFASSSRRGPVAHPSQFAFIPALEKQRTPFQSQVRLPLREFFSGRIELACVHSRSRHVGVDSAVPRSGQGYRMHAPYAASLAPRTRASLSLGFWFRL